MEKKQELPKVKKLSKPITSRTYSPTQGEINNEPSMTIPDMVPDLRTLVRRSRTGQLVPIMEGSFSSEDYPEFDRMDKTQLAQYRMDLADEMVANQKKLHAIAKEQEERDRLKKENKKEDIKTPKQQSATAVD